MTHHTNLPSPAPSPSELLPTSAEAITIAITDCGFLTKDNRPVVHGSVGKALDVSTRDQLIAYRWDLAEIKRMQRDEDEAREMLRRTWLRRVVRNVAIRASFVAEA
jgi:hypothetical protein